MALLLREALQLVQSPQLSPTQRLALVCSFEPLHLATFLQAHLVQRLPDETPVLIRFGYDQLERALEETATTLRASPALLCLAWDDLHTALSWRSRSGLGQVEVADVDARSEALRRRLSAWLAKRSGAETYVILPPAAWLPTHDPQPAPALGAVALAATRAMAQLAEELFAGGARILGRSLEALNLRDLLQAGCPLTLESSEEIARRLVEAAWPDRGRVKAVIVDLDGTLWSGVLAEDGPDGIAAGPDGKGAAFYLFRKFLRKLKAQGVLLAWCSKNNESDVLPLFDQVAAPLSIADFAAWECSWNAKSVGIWRLTDGMRIGTQDVVVIDDNPLELADIQRTIPEIRAWRTPRDAAGWQTLWRQLQQACGAWRIGEEDRLRTEIIQRSLELIGAMAELPVGALLADLPSLQLEVTINPNAFDDPRSLELINKTNQFNLNGERLTSEQLSQFRDRMREPFCVSARLRDRDGDFGTICVAIGWMGEDGDLHLRNLVLSCRAFGRRVEDLVLDQLCALGAWSHLAIRYIDTGKNEPARRFLARFGIETESGQKARIAREQIERVAREAREQSAARVRVLNAPTVAAV